MKVIAFILCKSGSKKVNLYSTDVHCHNFTIFQKDVGPDHECAYSRPLIYSHL